MSAMEHNINNRKEICQSTGTLLHVPNLVNFGQETAENGWRVFTPPPLNFRQPCRMDVIITDSRRTLARVM